MTIDIVEPMSLPRPIAWSRAHPRAADFALTVVVVAISLIAHAFGSPAGGKADLVHPTWWSLLLTLAGSVPIYWRRSHPCAVALVVVALQFVLALVDADGSVFLASAIAVYSLGAYSSGLPRLRTTITVGALLVVLFVAGWLNGRPMLDALVSVMIVLTAALVVGDNMRRRREHVVDLTDRAERAERERDLIAEQRVIAERTRIARELHDVVAHSVSLMVIQATAARRSLLTSPANAETAIANIELTGRQTMLELRTILGVLRTDDADSPLLQPNPTMADLRQLVESDDLPVSLRTHGAVDDLPASICLTIYRVVQEGLTNVRRHAGPVTRVDVVVSRSPQSLVITVRDDGRGAAADHLPSEGYGLRGMTERVAAVGGSVRAGPRIGGGWQITAELPAPRLGTDDDGCSDEARDSAGKFVVDTHR
jgi:signal transduction histidine kinase